MTLGDLIIKFALGCVLMCTPCPRSKRMTAILQVSSKDEYQSDGEYAVGSNGDYIGTLDPTNK